MRGEGSPGVEEQKLGLRWRLKNDGGLVEMTLKTAPQGAPVFCHLFAGTYTLDCRMLKERRYLILKSSITDISVAQRRIIITLLYRALEHPIARLKFLDARY